MSETLFDLSEEYEAMLNRGIGLSGETRDYFIAGRIQDLRSQLPRGKNVKRILDFGCGTGNTSHYLSQQFPSAQIVGVDTSEKALSHAGRLYGSARIRFHSIHQLQDSGSYDLCYVNGVFHHIVPTDRPAAIRTIYQALAPDGYLALFENNPWNLGARLVMSRIPFDRDAQMLSPMETRQLVCAGGFKGRPIVRSLFYFPRFLAGLRLLEPALAYLLLGAQYYILIAKT